MKDCIINVMKEKIITVLEKKKEDINCGNGSIRV